MSKAGMGKELLAFYNKKSGTEPSKTEEVLNKIKKLEGMLEDLEAFDWQGAAETSQKYTRMLANLRKLLSTGTTPAKVNQMLDTIEQEINKASGEAEKALREEEKALREAEPASEVELDEDDDFESGEEAEEDDEVEEDISSLVESEDISSVGESGEESESEESESEEEPIGRKHAYVDYVVKRTRVSNEFINSTFATVPSTGQIQTVLDAVDQQIRMLQEPVDKVTKMSDGQDDKVANVLDGAQQMIDKLEARKKYLKAYAKNNPFTKKQAYVAKKLDVDAAVLVLKGYEDELLGKKNLTKEDNQKLVALDEAKKQLRKRLTDIDQEMNSNTADELVDNPDLLLGPAGPLYEAKGLMGNAKKLGGKISEKRLDEPERKRIAEQLKTADLDQVPLASAAITENDVMRKFLVATLKQAGFDGVDSKAVNRRQRDQHVQARNQQEWKTVERKFLFRDKNGKQLECDSKVTPASQLGPTFDDLQGGGVCSHDTKSVKHATALCKTEVKVGGKTVFAGLRHGVNSARGIKEEVLAKMPDPELKEAVKEALMSQEFVSTDDFKDYHPDLGKKESDDEYLDRVVAGLKNDKGFRVKAAKLMKKNANVNRAKDMVKAALVMDPQKLDQALQSKQPLKIQMTSVGLQTAGMGMEGSMIADQREAWEAISGKTIPLQVKRKKVGKNGKEVVEEVTVQVKVEVNSFNFGVNSMAFGKGDKKGKVGWSDSDENVHRPLKILLGEKSEHGLGGQVGKWADDAERKLKQLKKEQPSQNRPQDVIAKESDELTKEIALVKLLAKDVCEMWEAEEYRQAGTAPYKMPARVAVLAQKLGQTPCFNCKSGKDRTSMMDVECKLLSTQMAVDGDLPPRNPEHDEKEQANRSDVAINSGNFEIQQLNASHMGYKLGNIKSLDKETNRGVAGTSPQTNYISAG